MAKPHLHLVPRLELPRVRGASRPYRIWDSEAKIAVWWRYYVAEVRAHNAALILARWEPVGRTLEVIDIRTGACFAIYKRGLNGIEITSLKEST